MPDAAGYGPDLPSGGGESINVTGVDPDPWGFSDLSYIPTSPEYTDIAGSMRTWPELSPEGFQAIMAGDSEEEAKTARERFEAFMKKFGKTLAKNPGLWSRAIPLLTGLLGITDFGSPGVSFNQGDATSAAKLLGVPTIPTPNPGATQSVSFLDWQPDNPMSNPESRFVDHQVYRPDLVPPDPNLLQALYDQLLSEMGGASGAGIGPGRASPTTGYKITPSGRALGGGRDGGDKSAF